MKRVIPMAGEIAAAQEKTDRLLCEKIREHLPDVAKIYAGESVGRP